MSQSTCVIPECAKRRVGASRLCSMHQARKARHGSPYILKRPQRSLPERFHLSYVVGPNDCWSWRRPSPNGYGMIYANGRPQWAHRAGYELLVGPIPKGLELDHLCRNRACVNPAHLEPVIHRENCLRGVSRNAENARKTHCLRGHEFTPENTYHPPKRPTRRYCRACARDNAQRRNLAA